MEILEATADGHVLTHPRLRGLLQYWRDLLRGRAMPARSDIDPIQIPRLLPHVILAELVGRRTRIRLVGTAATTAYGREMRGRDVEEFELGDFGPCWNLAFQRLRETAEPLIARGNFGRPSGLAEIELVLMPLSHDDRTVSHVFGGLSIRPLSELEMLAARPIAEAARLLRVRAR